MPAEDERATPHERGYGNTLVDTIQPFSWVAQPAGEDTDTFFAPRRVVRRFVVGSRWLETLALATLALALALLIGKAIGVAHYEATIVRYPFQIDDAEGVILSEATMIALGVNPYTYQPSPAHHFYAGPYTPLYTVINAAVVWIAGPTFAGGRIVQLLATLAVAAWIAWAIGRSARGPVARLVGVWAALLLLTCHLVAHWGVMVRPDMTALAWNLAGVALLRRWWDATGRERWRGTPWPQGSTLGVLALGAGCFALGWWTKQTYVAVPLSFILTLLPYRPKIAATLTGFYAAMVGLSLGVLTLLSAGGFVQKTYFYQASWTWDAYLFLARPFAHRYGLLPALALLSAIVICVRQRRLTFGVCFLAMAALKTLSAGTDGGNHNHFIELLVASALVAGKGVAALIVPAMPQSRAAVAPDRAGTTQRWATHFSLAGLAIILLLTGVAISEREGRGSWLAWEYRLPTAAERQGFQQAMSRVEGIPGPVYADNVGLGILAVSGHSVQVTDPFTLAAEVRLGRWDDSAVVDDVSAGRYRMIALRGDVAKMDLEHPPGDMTPGLIRAIRQHYHPVERSVVWLYMPNASSG
jgi:hypothetical protein